MNRFSKQYTCTLALRSKLKVIGGLQEEAIQPLVVVLYQQHVHSMYELIDMISLGGVEGWNLLQPLLSPSSVPHSFV